MNTRHRRTLAAILYLPLMLVLGLATSPGQAQVNNHPPAQVTIQDEPAATPVPAEECSAGWVCVEYEGLVIEIDPSCGPVAGLVTRETLIRETTLAESTEAYGLRAAIFLEQEDGSYMFTGHVSGPAVERFDDARFGAVGCMVWTGAEDE